ncbi:unnamed protein product [Brassica napus]|uniref:(rape) hypothetical protein n=1 Tax=Brassica napus TaxID=3708 RepID=A0A816RW17_BRANA|nr:unnamed protein product [Brassica napus]
MSNHYTNTVSTVLLLFFLFISSASSSSFIRQYTDDSNTNFQEENGAVPDAIQGEAHYLRQHEQEISSRDYKLSVSNTVKGLRDRPPSSYSLKMESFNTLLKSTNADKYVSRPFSAAGYKWTLIVYPNGNKNDNGAGFLSLYVAIDNSTLSPHQEVFVDLRFYVFNRVEKKYLTIQDTDGWRFSYFKTMWGFSQVLPVNTFKDSNNGYLYDGDHCEFGVDVTTPTVFKESELFTVTDKFYNPKYTWSIQKFSTLLEDSYYSDVFSIGGRRWNIKVYPGGSATGKGKAVSIFLILNANEKFRPYEKIYVGAKLRVLNQRNFKNIEKQIDNWYNGPGYGDGSGWGYNEFIPFSDLKDSSKGFLVNDVLMVQVEIEAISSTKTLMVYPNGNKKDSGSGYLSLYVAIDNSTLVAGQQEVYADLRFYVFNNNERKYFTIQDTNVWRFNVFKTMWGFSQVLPVATFKDPKNGYLYDGDHCEFGVDVTIPTTYQVSELFSIADNFYNPKFTWTIRGFSTLFKDTYYSDLFSIGGRTWTIQVNPSGRGTGAGKALSMYLNLDVNEKLRPYEKIYVRGKLRVLNQRGLNNIERQLDIWYQGPGYGEYSWGYHEFISFSDLRDSAKGFVVNDVLMVQAELEDISSTKYLPN